MTHDSETPPPASPLTWAAALEAVVQGQMRLMLTAASGGRAVLIAETELAGLERRADRADAEVVLTERERQALLLIEEGHPVNEVAQALGVAVGTAVQHLAAARRKYGVTSSAEAAACARRAGTLN